MTPKKAIIIVLVLFLIMIMAFTFLYFKKQLAGPGDNSFVNTSASSTSQGKSSQLQQKIEAIENKTNEQVEKIVERGQTATGGITVDAQRKVEETVNQEITEKLKLKTPEQLKADQQRQAELDKMQQQINQQIKDQLQNK